MQKKISYREINKGEEEKVCRLIMDIFSEFIAPGYSDEGINEMTRYVNPDFTRFRLANNHFIILALDNDEIAGVIEARNYNHISLFFVRKEYQNKGIGKKLTELAINKCKTFKPELTVIDVHSSPYAVQIYERLGFVKQSEEQISNGMRFTPLMLKLGL